MPFTGHGGSSPPSDTHRGPPARREVPAQCVVLHRTRRVLADSSPGISGLANNGLPTVDLPSIERGFQRSALTAKGIHMRTTRSSRRRSTASVVGVALFSAVVGGGVAVAMFGGTIGGVDLATGLAAGQSTPCQSDPVNFKLVQPRWNGADKAFTVRQITYADFSSACVSVGARLHLAGTEGNSTFLDTVLTPTATSGTVDLDVPVNANRAPTIQINYLVEG